MTPMSRVDTLRNIEHEVGVLIRRVRRVIHERARAVHPDLLPASYLLLAHLVESGPCRPSAVAELFGVDKGSISRQVRQLVDLGLVDRTRDPEDGRATLLAPPADAVARADEVARQRRLRLDDRLGDWSDEELAGFVAALARYNASLE